MTDLRATALAFDLRRPDAEFLEDPFPIYRAVREHDPVHRMPARRPDSRWLARMEGQVAIGRLVQRFATIERDAVRLRP